MCVNPNLTFPHEAGLWGHNSLAVIEAGARPALARLNRFEGTTQVYCLRENFLELTGKTRSGPGKGADAEMMTGGFDLARRRARIEEVWEELSLESISFFKNQSVQISGYWGSP